MAVMVVSRPIGLVEICCTPAGLICVDNDTLLLDLNDEYSNYTGFIIILEAL